MRSMAARSRRPTVMMSQRKPQQRQRNRPILRATLIRTIRMATTRSMRMHWRKSQRNQRLDFANARYTNELLDWNVAANLNIVTEYRDDLIWVAIIILRYVYSLLITFDFSVEFVAMILCSTVQDFKCISHEYSKFTAPFKNLFFFCH